MPEASRIPIRLEARNEKHIRSKRRFGKTKSTAKRSQYLFGRIAVSAHHPPRRFLRKGSGTAGRYLGEGLFCFYRAGRDPVGCARTAARLDRLLSYKSPAVRCAACGLVADMSGHVCQRQQGRDGERHAGQEEPASLLVDLERAHETKFIPPHEISHALIFRASSTGLRSGMRDGPVRDHNIASAGLSALGHWAHPKCREALTCEKSCKTTLFAALRGDRRVRRDSYIETVLSACSARLSALCDSSCLVPAWPGWGSGFRSEGITTRRRGRNRNRNRNRIRQP
jgi:hypothetical protein